jgi:hypothetical protein
VRRAVGHLARLARRGAALAAFGFVWLVSKATEKPGDGDARADALFAALSRPKDGAK